MVGGFCPFLNVPPGNPCSMCCSCVGVPGLGRDSSTAGGLISQVIGAVVVGQPMSATKASPKLSIYTCDPTWIQAPRVLRKETENVLTSHIKSPAIPARRLWLWPHCADIACFIRKMSPVWCFCVAFPVSQVFPVFGVQVRPPVANFLGFAVLYKMCPGWLLSWFSLGAGLSGTFRLQVSKFSVKNPEISVRLRK